MKKNKEELNKTLVGLITTLTDNDSLSVFCEETGYNRIYLQRIKAGGAKGSEYYNEIIIREISKFIKKNNLS